MRIRTERYWAMVVAFTCALACGGTDPEDDASVDLGAAANATSREGGTRFSVGGTLSGLSGDAVTLRDNGSYDTLTLSANGTFIFAKPLKNHSTYAVTVLTQPSAQTCTVANGTGTIAGANVTNVAVSCSPNPVTYYTLGGSLSGLSGSVVLTDGGENLTLTANGSFTFTTPLAGGSGYSVTVASQPSNQLCTVTSGTGTISGSNVTSVAVSCQATSSPSPVATPVFSPAPGMYDFVCYDYQCYFSVTLSDATPGATMYYALDGSEPSVVDGVPQGGTYPYEGEIRIYVPVDSGCYSYTGLYGGPLTIKAMAIVNRVSSAVASGDYDLSWCSTLF